MERTLNEARIAEQLVNVSAGEHHSKEVDMIPAVIERCAGIDACVMTGPAKEEAEADIRKFGTLRAELVRLREWLQAEGVRMW